MNKRFKYATKYSNANASRLLWPIDENTLGENYATKYSNANASRLLWPIDENTLGENEALKQTPGYEN